MAASPSYSAAPSAPSSVDQKVSAAVRAAASTSDKITFWVTFSARADLSAAQAKRAKADKGAEVRRLKMQTATTSQAGVRHFLDGAGADYQTFWISNRIKVTGASKMVETLAAMPEVATIEETKTIALPAPIVEPTGLPTVNAVEWGIDRINAPRVWSELGTTGESIVVANIDTGVDYTHPAVASKYRGLGAGGALDHNYNWFDPSDVCPSAAPCDNNDHGTHTMGTMVGSDGANQIGVAPGAKWIAAKGCESSSCSDAALLSSGEWIIAPTDLNGANPRPDLAPDVVNNSWGGAGFDPFYQDIVDSWNAAGIFPAFSNGNAGSACNTSGSPGIYLNSYASGAFDINNVIASFSSRGPGVNGDIKPNLAAPGVNVRSSVPGGGYDNFSGTSMASPHTAGAVALAWSASPALRGDIAATRALLDSTAVDVDATTCGGTAADNNVFGEGKLDAFALVSAAPRGDLGALNGVITSGGSPLAGATVLADGPIDRTFTTGADGAYSFPVLSVGDYVVTASKYGYNNASGNATVTVGATTTLNLSLTQAVSSTISGTVTSAGAAVAGASVSLAGTPLATTTNAAGFYSLTAPNGAYTLNVSSPLRCADSVSQAVTLTADVTVNVALPERTDGFGYACGAATGAYPSVSTLVSLTGDDAQAAVALPFPVPFYGTNYSSITVTTNGSAAFGAGTSATQTNVAIPSTSLPNGAIYPMWDDLMVDAEAGVYTGVIGTSPHRKFVIEWRNVRSFFDITNRLSFVAEIGEDGGITYRYKDVAGTSFEAGSSASIGLENATGTVGFQYSFNTAVLTDGTAIAFRTTRHGVVRGTVTDANDGLALAGATVAFGAGGSATTGADGGYLVQVPSGAVTATFSKANYETATQAITLPAADVVIADKALRTAKVTANPATLSVVVPAGQSRIRTVTITNSGTLATPVSQSESPEAPWLGASLAATSLAPGASTRLTLAFDATGLTPGNVYSSAIKITSQSGRSPELLIPVKLIVPGFQDALDSGSNNSHVDPSGDTWEKDQKYVANQGCGYLGTTTVVTTNHAITGTDDPARFANARQNMYEYRCDGLLNGTYTVELNFAELTNTKPNKRIFDVMLEGTEVLPNLDINLETGGNYIALSRTYTVTVTDGILNIRFITHTGFNKPIISALRVTHRPDLGA